ncbi:MAG: chromosomal replication initiator protein DnaA [Kiritimatiellia bacterium]|jgi:chromosomal replication initiator protein
MDLPFLWTQACEHLKSVLNEDIYTNWIAIIHPLSLEKDNLVLQVDNNIQQLWLETNYKSLVLQALQIGGAPESLDIQFQAKNADEPRVEEPPAPKPAPPTQRKGRKVKVSALQEVQALLTPNYTFEEFVVGPSNSFAHAAALAVAQSPGHAYNPLFIYGQTGLGKTHLMQAIGHQALQNPNMKVLYVSSEALLNEYLNSLQNKSTFEFRSRYRNVDVLLVDDIHFLAGKSALQEEFFNTFNALYLAHKQIIMTSDRPPSEIDGLEQRLVSRFVSGMVTELEVPTFETRLTILRYKQSHQETQLPSEVLTFIAENISSNVRALEGALTRASSFAKLHRQPITLDALRHILRDLLEEERQEDLRFEDIQKAVAEYYGVRLSDMTSKQRQRSVALPRQVAMYLCRLLTRASLPQIAEAFEKTHATVLHACKVIHNHVEIDATLRQAVHFITRKLGRDPASLQR